MTVIDVDVVAVVNTNIILFNNGGKTETNLVANMVIMVVKLVKMVVLT